MIIYIESTVRDQLRVENQELVYLWVVCVLGLQGLGHRGILIGSKMLFAIPTRHSGSSSPSTFVSLNLGLNPSLSPLSSLSHATGRHSINLNALDNKGTCRRFSLSSLVGQSQRMSIISAMDMAWEHGGMGAWGH